jgi:hypothetical protein
MWSVAAMKTKHYINLTNGIQAIQEHNLKDYNFIRIQSTHCEQKQWEKILVYLSDDFLMNLALGNECIVYDYGANKNIPRAVWQGLEWVKFVLYLRWYNIGYAPEGRAKNSGEYFMEQYNALSTIAKGRIDYYKKFLRGGINLQSKTGRTMFDGNHKYYAEVLP